MPVDTYYATAMSNGIASLAPPSVAAPTDLSALPAPWVDLGAMTTNGLTENLSETRTEYKRWGSISSFRSTITDQKHTFDVEFLESNPNVLGLFYRVGAAATPTQAGVNAVQTVTITGAPTAGTFTLTFAGQTTTPLPFNATSAQVAAALIALSNIGNNDVAVSGNAGGPYAVTFTGQLGMQPNPVMTATSSLTGGTTPAVAVANTTPGVSGDLISITDDTSGQRDVRAMTFDLLDGNNHFRFYCPAAEVTNRKNVVYKTDGLTTYGVTVTAYPNTAGVSVQRYMRLDAIVNNL